MSQRGVLQQLNPNVPHGTSTDKTGANHPQGGATTSSQTSVKKSRKRCSSSVSPTHSAPNPKRHKGLDSSCSSEPMSTASHMNSEIDSANSLSPRPETMELSDKEMRRQIRMTFVPTCDRKDGQNPVRCSEYASIICDNLYKIEERFMVSPEMITSLSANHDTKSMIVDQRVRAIMIDWLHKVWVQFELKPEVLHQTISLLDRYNDVKLLEGRPVKRDEYQLIGCTCMWIASKYNEIYAPEMRDFVHIASRSFTTQDLQRTERDILTALDFELTIPSVYTFTQRFLHIAQPLLEGDRRERSVHVAMYFVESSLHDHKCLEYAPSLIAATAVYLGMAMTKSGHWFDELEKSTGYKESDMRELIQILRRYVLEPCPLHKSVRARYAKEECGKVSLLVTRKG